MKYVYALLILIGLCPIATAKQLSKERCEEVWSQGEILHDFDELEIAGGNYRPRSYIRYKAAMYYGIITIKSGKGKNAQTWVAMNCWDSANEK